MIARGMRMYALRPLASVIGQRCLDLVPHAAIDTETILLLNQSDNGPFRGFSHLAPVIYQTTATPHGAPEMPGIYASALTIGLAAGATFVVPDSQ